MKEQPRKNEANIRTERRKSKRKKFAHLSLRRSDSQRLPLARTDIIQEWNKCTANPTLYRLIRKSMDHDAPTLHVNPNVTQQN